MDIGIIGLGVMGENLALNMASRGFAVIGFDREEARRTSFAQRTQGARARAAASMEELAAALQRPRRLLVMVPAGAAVDAVLAALRPLLDAGDVIIDGGNTLHTDTERRIAGLAGSGIRYVGSGVSGGEEGALRGPALMPGGDAQAWPLIAPVLQAIAARAEDGEPCCDWIGPGGSGHFVKMVHNGIEYGDMQMICEAYWLMHRWLGLDASEMADVFADWNRGELDSYLIDITARILRQGDEHDPGTPLVDRILDTAEQKGTGRWTSQQALELGVPAPSIADAVFARTLSSLKTERVAASRVLAGPDKHAFHGDRAAMVEKIRHALLASKICSYAQGFALLRAADAAHGWGLRPGRIASLWRAGCIIRAGFLGRIREAFERDAALPNLLVDPYFASVLHQCQADWREVVAQAALQGVAAPTFMSALAYFDSYRSERLPANLLQAQRDFFGAHTYQRTDRPGSFHTRWTGD